jgi:hypothetical protein
MDSAPQPILPEAPRKAVKQGGALILAKSAFAAALAACAIAGVAHWEGGFSIWPARVVSDNVTDAERQTRSDAFAMMASLPLARVPDQDVSSAIDSMHLPPSQQEALRSAALASSITPASSPETQPARPAQMKARRKSLLSEAGKPERLRLAWLTLWDTDAEDGDVVRISSQGYSRTVTLTKAPITFAIPVPADGVVKVTGVRDGDGGGVTVGLASGASKAVFPVMSIGQVLGLKVKVD